MTTDDTAASLPGRLQIDTATGKITGPADLSCNDPFPCVNGDYDSGAMMGVVEHTMDGSYEGTISWFNTPAAEVSAHFGISNEGQIHQFGPVGKGWCAWAEAAGNDAWYSIEHEDDEDPARPLTAAQITASAQLVEVLSRFAGFPLQVSDSPDVKGYITHAAGGVPWGDHPDCPGSVRAAQRTAIIELAVQIRAGVRKVILWLVIDDTSLNAQADAHGTTPAVMLDLAAKEHHDYGPAMKEYIKRGDYSARLPHMTVLYAYA